MTALAVLAVLAVFLVHLPAGAAEEGTPAKPAAERIAGRLFPSVFQAWSPADNLPEKPPAVAARHDLIFQGAPFYGLRWNHAHTGLADGFTPESLREGLRRRGDLLERNPHLVLLMEIRYRDAPRSYLPADHAWWKRDAAGNIAAGWEEGGFLKLDFANAGCREQVARQARAAVASGVVDGIMLDWWQDDDDHLALVKAIREQIGRDALILANANDRVTPRTAPFLNGYFLECYRTQTAEDWRRIAATLVWAGQHLQPPRINCLETWYHQSRADEHLMRATTALSLVFSDGYCLFSDPNPLPTPDHRHDWYPFWEPLLGRPLAPGKTRPDGAASREFTRGTAVYNPMGNPPVTVRFDSPHTSRATGRRGSVHTLGPCDGDLYLLDDRRPPPEEPHPGPAR